MNKPTARKTNIVVQEVDDEILIYDLRKNKAFCLNKTSSFIWRMCDGKNTSGEIANKLGKEFRKPVGKELIDLALFQFADNDLIEEKLKESFTGLSRREAIRKAGFASAIALPMVSSLVAPKASMAQSGLLALGQTCGDDPECASGNCTLVAVGGLQCCAANTFGGGVALQPGLGTSCVTSQSACDSSASGLCCSGRGTLMQAPGCPNGTEACICADF